jgi:TonB family protein
MHLIRLCRVCCVTPAMLAISLALVPAGDHVLEASLSAQAPTSIEALLALPPSPGLEVLLQPHAGDARVQLRWRQALSDENADRRAAAARMIGIAAVRTAVGGLMVAVAKEQDAVARIEMLRALIVVGSAVSDKVVLQHLHEVPEGLSHTVVRTMATVRPASITDFALAGGVLSGTRSKASMLGAALHARLLRVSPTDAARLEAEPERLAPGTLQGILHMTHVSARKVAAPLLLAGLRTDLGTAGEVLAYLPAVHSRPLDADTPLAKDYAAWRSAQPAGGDPNHEFLLALADRWLRRASAATPTFDRIDPRIIEELQVPPVAYAVLSRDERRALVQRLALTGDEAKAIEGAGFLVRDRESDYESSTPQPLLLADLPGAVLADLVRLTGCDGKAYETDRALTTKYRPDGRPLSIVVGGVELDAACDRLVQLIASASYGVPTLTNGDAGRALLRLLPDFVACQVDRDADVRRVQPTPSPDVPFVMPRKVKDQKPAYPLAAQKASLQGVVVVNVLIASTGCVADAVVLRSIPPLDLPALQAIAAWRYEPPGGGQRGSLWVVDLINFKSDF